MSLYKGNVHICYELSEGNKDMSTLIFLHGLGGDLTAWEPIVNHFKTEGYATLCIDLRGHGLSDKPAMGIQYSLPQFADDIVQLIHVLNIHRAIIIGHCFGGMVGSTIVSNKHPEIIGLILINSSYTFPTLFSFFLNNHIIHTILKKSIPFIPLYLRKPLHRNLKKFSNTGDWNIFRISSDILSVGPRVYIALTSELYHFTLLERMKHISIPTCIISALDDSVYPLKVAQQLQAAIPHSLLKTIPEGGHIAPIKRPESIIQELEQFLSSVHL